MWFIFSITCCKVSVNFEKVLTSGYDLVSANLLFAIQLQSLLAEKQRCHTVRFRGKVSESMGDLMEAWSYIQTMAQSSDN